MWKNIFIEAAILSVIIFGGFYINANLMIKEIRVSQENLLGNQAESRVHISGVWNPDLPKVYMSGNSTVTDHPASVSGFTRKPGGVYISGRKI